MKNNSSIDLVYTKKIDINKVELIIILTIFLFKK